jgi:hypothetical protein
MTIRRRLMQARARAQSACRIASAKIPKHRSHGNRAIKRYNTDLPRTGIETYTVNTQMVRDKIPKFSNTVEIRQNIYLTDMHLHELSSLPKRFKAFQKHY